MSFALVVALLSSWTARATTVAPPSFRQLVSEAHVIAQGSVTSVSSRWVDAPPRPVIKTYVTFTVEKTLKGAHRESLTLEFLGGTVGTESMRVTGMPDFKLGERSIVFVQGNGVQFCPLVRFGHGRYHIREDHVSKRCFVTRNDDSPLTCTDDVSRPIDPHGAAPHEHRSAEAMTPDEFVTRICRELDRSSR